MNNLSLDSKLVCKILCALLAIVFCMRITNGYFMAILVLISCFAAMTRRNGLALLGYITIPIVLFLNKGITGNVAVGFIIARFGFLFLPFFFMMSGLRSGRMMSVPLGWLYLYLLFAVVSSSFGWFPVISYLKILNFALFIIGVQMGVRALNGNISDILMVRSGFFAVSLFVVIGSLLVYPFPSIGYSMEVANAIRWGATGTDAQIAMGLASSGGNLLYSGVLNHSQVLSPMVAMLSCFVLCDLTVIEHKMTLLHLMILVVAPVVLFLTRSRTGMFSFLIACLMIYCCVVPKVRISAFIRQRLKSLFVMCFLLLILCAIAAELKSGAISGFVHKWDKGDARQMDTVSALTESRMGLVEANMNDFKLNPYIGKGFQTMEAHRWLYNAGQISLLSAPIEKGVLPTMILGEGGIVGAIIFTIFLVSFYSKLNRAGNLATICIFTTFLATNMGESSFFSPGGHGSMYWLISIVGGLSIDYIGACKHNMLVKVVW